MINKAELVRKTIKEFTTDQGVKYSKKKLSEIIYKRHPDLFTSAEHARNIVKKVTGSGGERANKEYKQIEWKGLILPEPEKEDYTKVQVDQKRIAILSDIHFPYYDKKALDSALKSSFNFSPDCIILNGDIIDVYHLSSFEKDPKKRSFSYELSMLKNFFEQLRSKFPKTRIIFKSGNHDDRYERFILNRIPELIDLNFLSLENVIEAKNWGIEVVKNKRVIKIGNSLNVIHGHELRAGIISPVNIARGFFLKTKVSTLGGHHHRTSEHIEHDLNGQFIGCFSTGCLCGLTPQYMPINSHNHGFALVENYGAEFHVRNLKIIDGKVL